MPKLDIAFIIDDDQMFTYILSRQMKLLDFSEKTLIFQNGLEALKYLKLVVDSPGELPSVILLDLNMPVLDGWQFLDEFIKLKVGKKITVFLISSSIDQADHARALAYKEVSRFYIKPITKKNLYEMINVVIAG
jgi:CheY-like chemotaxis protein